MVRTINKKDQLALGSDDEDDFGSRSGSPSLRPTPEPDPKRQQQFLSPSSPDDRALWGRVAGLVARGAPKTMMSGSSSSPMSSPDALNKAKAATSAEKAREGYSPRAQMTTASQPRKTDEEEEAELHVPGSFDFGDHGGGTPRETPGASTVGRSVRCCRCDRQSVAADAGEMMVRTSKDILRFILPHI